MTMNTTLSEYWNDTHDEVRRMTDPVFFIENKIKVAGFPLILHPKVSEFVYRLNREREITTHDIERGGGLTTGILAYLVWKAYNRPSTNHIIISPRFIETIEKLIYIAAMARSVGPILESVGKDIVFKNGSVITGISIKGSRGLQASTLVCDGFHRLTGIEQAELALRASTGFLGDHCQTIFV